MMKPKARGELALSLEGSLNFLVPYKLRNLCVQIGAEYEVKKVSCFLWKSYTLNLTKLIETRFYLKIHKQNK